MNSSNSFNMLIILLFIHIYFVYWHEYMKINIINFENLDKYQRLIKKKNNIKYIEYENQIVYKRYIYVKRWLALIWFDLSFKNWTILRIISNSSNNLNLNRGCVCFSYQIFFVTVALMIYHWSKCITASFNEILLILFLGAMV